jgi:peptide/nickel transport system permease protein
MLVRQKQQLKPQGGNGWQRVHASVLRTWHLFKRSKLGLIGILVILVFLVISILAPVIVPYKPLEKHYDGFGNLKALMLPSKGHWLGTTLHGRDVFSQVIMGTRNALIVGVLTAFFVALIGLNIGLFSGYYGGYIDNLLMRITDVVYGVPVLPFAIVALSLLTRNTLWIIFIMSSLFWTPTARVIRSQVLSLRERPFIDGARISGASNLRIIYKHIAPNVLPQAFVHGAFAVAWAITTEASICFLGFGDPYAISWGTIIYDVFTSLVMYKAWWWFLPPGICIVLVVMSFYFIGRAYEEIANPRLRGV